MYPDRNENLPQSQKSLQALQTRIESDLFFNDRLSSRGIEVEATEGGVYLRGQVQSYRRKEEAERTALSVCTELAIVPPLIINELEVTGESPRTDGQLSAAARRKLDRSEGVHKPGLIVEARSGVAHVSGNVRSPAERKLVGDILLSVPGIRRLRNLLLVDPDLARRDANIGERIRRRLISSSYLAGSRLSVGVANGRALISGRVREAWQRSLAERAVREVYGRLVRVDNSIRIQEAA